MVLTPGNVNDSTMLADTIETIRVPACGPGRPRTRFERVLADKGYPSRTNRASLVSRGIKSTIPDRADQKAHRANRGAGGGRPTAFDAEFYKGRNVVERSFNRLKNWKGIAMRSDKTARNYQAGVDSRRDPELGQHRLIQHVLAEPEPQHRDHGNDRGTPER